MPASESVLVGATQIKVISGVKFITDICIKYMHFCVCVYGVVGYPLSIDFLIFDLIPAAFHIRHTKKCANVYVFV